MDATFGDAWSFFASFFKGEAVSSMYICTSQADIATSRF